MAEEQERGISLLQTWTSRVNLYPPPNLNSNMLKTDLKASSTTRTWLNPVSTRKLLGWSSLNTRYSGGPVWALNNYCFSNHCNVHDLLFTLINSTTVCHNFSSVHHSVKLWFSIMWSVEFFSSNLLSSMLWSSISTTLLPHAAAEKKGASWRSDCGKGRLSQAV